MSKMIFPTIVYLLFATFSAHASPVTLLQEQKEIACEFAQQHPKLSRILIDRKDTLLTATDLKSATQDYERIKFLDSAVLFRSKAAPNVHLLFQIFPNGEITLTEGDLLPMKESDCEDTGASKTCKNQGLQKLFWSPERLSLIYSNGSVDLAIDSYGFLANHATYFRAKNPKRGSLSLTLLDYGAPVEILAGRSYEMKCKYN